MARPRTYHALAALVVITLTGMFMPASASAQPSIDFGSHFHFRTIPSEETRGRQRVGLVQFELAAKVVDGAGGSLTVYVAQRGRELTRFSCPVETRGRQRMTRCGSASLLATDVDAARSLEVRTVHTDDTTDAETEVYQASFPVIRYWSWVGTDRRGRPEHVEQRALRLDSALGFAVARQADFGRSGDVVTDSAIQFAWWDARAVRGRIRSNLRCRVGDAEWRSFRVSGPGTENDSQEVANRVMGRDGEVREGEGESVTYQQYHLTVYDLPFWVSGSPTTITAPDPTANGAWTCQVRTGAGADRRVLRAFTFDVVDGALVQPAAAAAVSMAPGAAVVGVQFDPRALPAMFDPDLVRAGFYGMVWPEGMTAPVVGELPRRAQSVAFTAPAGTRRQRRR